MRAASSLLQELVEVSMNDEPLRSKLLRSAGALSNSEASRDCLETLETCIDLRSKSPSLVQQEQVRPLHCDRVPPLVLHIFSFFHILQRLMNSFLKFDCTIGNSFYNSWRA